MNSKEMEDFVVQQYQRDEQMMIMIFAQWCVNNKLDAMELYQRAYPQQRDNYPLQQAMENTVSKEEAGEIPDATLLGVLSMFGNEELAFVVTQEIEARKPQR